MIYYLNNEIPEIKIVSKKNIGEVTLNIVSINKYAELIILNLKTEEISLENVSTNVDLKTILLTDVEYEIYAQSIDEWQQRSRVSEPISINFSKVGQNILSDDIRINVSDLGCKFLLDVQNKVNEKINIKYAENMRQINSSHTKFTIHKNVAREITINRPFRVSPDSLVQLDNGDLFVNDFSIAILPMFNYVTIKVTNNTNLLKVFRINGNDKNKIFSLTEGKIEFIDKKFPYNLSFYYRFEFYDQKFNIIRVETSDIFKIEQNKYYGPSSKIIRNTNSTNLLNDDYKIIKNINNINVIDLNNMEYNNILVSENNINIMELQPKDMTARRIFEKLNESKQNVIEEEENIIIPESLVNFEHLTNGYTEVNSKFSIINPEKFAKIEIYNGQEKIDTLTASENMDITFMTKKFNKNSKLKAVLYDNFNKKSDVKLSLPVAKRL